MMKQEYIEENKDRPIINNVDNQTKSTSLQQVMSQKVTKSQNKQTTIEYHHTQCDLSK